MKRPENNQQFSFVTSMLFANRLQTTLDQKISDLTLKQWLLICMLNQMQGSEVTVNELAAVMGYTRQNTKKMIDVLVNKGYVSLAPAENDRRAYSITLTQKSYDYFQANDQMGEELLKQIFAGIPDDQVAVYADTLVRLLENLEKM